MTFGEKVRSARIAIGITQRELAERSGISLRTIQNYESGERMPKQKEYYTFLAQALKVDENELKEQEASLRLPRYETERSFPKDIRRLLDDIVGLYSGGTLADEDMDAMMKAIQDAYWIAKENNRKYAPRKYRRDPDKSR